MNKEQRDKLASALGIPKEEQTILDAGSSHHYECRCDICLAYWVLMRPQDPETGHGPFTENEIKAARARIAREADERGPAQ